VLLEPSAQAGHMGAHRLQVRAPRHTRRQRGGTRRQAGCGAQALFTSHLNPKYFLFYLSHQIFRHMYRALNVDKKDN
jgi:hypothetical protein